MTWREGSFRTFKPKWVCACEHPLDVFHLEKGRCRVEGCDCQKFKRAFKPNKLHAKRTEFNGVQYHSGLEARVAADLDYQKRCGEIKGWERQVKIQLEVLGKHVCNYYIDMVVTHNDGTIEYVEVKGFETAEWRLKWKLFEIIYGQKPKTKLTVKR